MVAPIVKEIAKEVLIQVGKQIQDEAAEFVDTVNSAEASARARYETFDTNSLKQQYRINLSSFDTSTESAAEQAAIEKILMERGEERFIKVCKKTIH